MCISPHPNLWSKGCTDGNTKAITTKDAVRENPVIRDGRVPSPPQLNTPSWALRGRDVFALNVHSHWKEGPRFALSD